MADATFTIRCDAQGSGPRLAVKDLIDVHGLPTTCGSQARARVAEPAEKDAECLARARAAGARIVGLTNLHELAFGISGINDWTGTPVNPLDARLVPGGSSSGSAVAVATDEADIAFGSDTTGSIRIPAACCGVAGLKTTSGRVPLGGVWSISETLDTVGPMGVDVASVVLGMQLLEPGFEVDEVDDFRVGRFRISANPAISRAIDVALAEAELSAFDIELPEWRPARLATSTIANFDGWRANRELFEATPELIGDDVRADLIYAQSVSQSDVDNAFALRETWIHELQTLFETVDVIAMPTLADFPPTLSEAHKIWEIPATHPWSLTGVPALSIPIPTTGSLPASLQLIAPWNCEELLLALGRLIESAVD